MKFSCKKCDYKTNLKVTFRHHKKEKHDPNKEQTQCEECGYVGSKTNLRIHKLIHGGGKVQCENCDYSTFKPFHMKEHVKNIHEPEYIHCDKCTFMTKRLSHLKIHNERVHEEKVYKCDIC